MRGVSFFGVLIGLEIEKHIVAGAAYFLALDEVLYAAEGSGCFLNGLRCRVSSDQSLACSIVSFTNAASFKAAGRLELMLDPIMNPYDCGPFPVILREAGGYFGDWSGNETISTSRGLLPEVLNLIRSA